MREQGTYSSRGAQERTEVAEDLSRLLAADPPEQGTLGPVALELGSLAKLYGVMEALTAEVQSLRAEVRAIRGPAPRAPKSLLSLREVAKRLGIRNESVPDLIADRKLKTVKVNGKPKVPASEVERLAREGFDTRRS